MSRIIIVDDHPLFRTALRQTLTGQGQASAVEEAGDLSALTAALEADRDCDLVLLDLNMPGAHGFSGLLLLRAQYPDLPVMIVSAIEEPVTIRRTFSLGAAGYLRKSEGPAGIRAAYSLSRLIRSPTAVLRTTTISKSGVLPRFLTSTSSPSSVSTL